MGFTWVSHGSLRPRFSPVTQLRSSDATDGRHVLSIPQVVYVQFNYVAPGATAAELETELARPVLGDRKLVMRFQTKLY